MDGNLKKLASFSSLETIYSESCQKLNTNRISYLLSGWSGMLYVWVKILMNEGVVSKETVVLRRWGSSIQKFGFINGVDNVNWPPYRDSKSPY